VKYARQVKHKQQVHPLEQGLLIALLALLILFVLVEQLHLLLLHQLLVQLDLIALPELLPQHLALKVKGQLFLKELKLIVLLLVLIQSVSKLVLIHQQLLLHAETVFHFLLLVVPHVQLAVLPDVRHAQLMQQQKFILVQFAKTDSSELPPLPLLPELQINVMPVWKDVLSAQLIKLNVIKPKRDGY
jgi:hypothetical protein